MKQKNIFSGSQALVEGALYAGCRYFFGNTRPCSKDIISYISKRMPEVNGIFIQTEDEPSAISMCIGAGATGARVLTAVSVNGLGLMRDGLSYLYYERIPCVVACIMGEEIGDTHLIPTQNAYNFIVKGWQNFRLPVLCPINVNDMFSLMNSAFEIADKYRVPVIFLSDLILTYMSEIIEIETELLPLSGLPTKDWILSGAKNREPRVLTPEFDKELQSLLQKELIEKESRYWYYNIENSEYLIVAYGAGAYIIYDILKSVNDNRIGLFSPISLYPPPVETLYQIASNKKKIIVVEMNEGQLFEDINLILSNKIPVIFKNLDYSVIAQHKTLNFLEAMLKN